MSLPPLPWSYQVTALRGEHEGSHHVYIVDATGRKIASIWGKPVEKMMIVNLIMAASGEASNAGSLSPKA